MPIATNKLSMFEEITSNNGNQPDIFVTPQICRFRKTMPPHEIGIESLHRYTGSLKIVL